MRAKMVPAIKYCNLNVKASTMIDFFWNCELMASPHTELIGMCLDNSDNTEGPIRLERFMLITTADKDKSRKSFKTRCMTLYKLMISICSRTTEWKREVIRNVYHPQHWKTRVLTMNAKKGLLVRQTEIESWGFIEDAMQS